jgi:hypothetical protein
VANRSRCCLEIAAKPLSECGRDATALVCGSGAPGFSLSVSQNYSELECLTLLVVDFVFSSCLAYKHPAESGSLAAALRKPAAQGRFFNHSQRGLAQTCFLISALPEDGYNGRDGSGTWENAGTNGVCAPACQRAAFFGVRPRSCRFLPEVDTATARGTETSPPRRGLASALAATNYTLPMTFKAGIVSCLAITIGTRANFRLSNL